MGYRKLSDADKLGVRKMLDDGCTYQEAASKFGITQGYAERLFPHISCRGNRTGRREKLHTCNVPAIGDYIAREKITIKEFAVRCGISYMVAYRTLYSEGKPHPHARNINGILRATGMTYEEAFGRQAP